MGQRPHPGWTSRPGWGQGCAQHPSQGHKQFKGLWEHRPDITHPPWQPLAGWDGAGLAPEGHMDLPVDPYGVRSQLVAGGGGRGSELRDPRLKATRCGASVGAPPKPVVQKEQSASLFPSLYSFTLLPYFCFIEIYKIQIHQKKNPNAFPKRYFAIKYNKLAINKRVV